ncbi:MAG: hypothetical protein JWP31_2120, partial [Aeromicrobium sp.]|nr:hypothetical protein [Aeromicrobium sp.]
MKADDVATAAPDWTPPEWEAIVAEHS